jgi:dolichol-phosphate mannosyltransferase
MVSTGIGSRGRLSPRSVGGASWWLVRLALAGLAASRLARAARRRPPLLVDDATASPPHVSIVVPARDEARRIQPLLEALRRDPTVSEVLVVDDQSSDETTAIAARLGATVVTGATLPPGWVGKPWALEQGLRAAGGEWVVTMDADVVPERGLAAALVARAARDDLDVVTVAGRFQCPTAGLRWLHPALLTTIVYRFGPAGASRPPRPSRALANGQCAAFRRQALLDAGGFSTVAGHLTDDVALVRHLARRGWRTAMLDGTSVLAVRMHEDAAQAWRDWGRSLSMPDVATPASQVLDLATLAVAQALPLPRLLLGRGDALDAILLALRLGTLVGTRRAYGRADLPYWLSPLADPAAFARVAWGALRPGRRWKGRTYR